MKSKKAENKYWENEQGETVDLGKGKAVRCYDKAGKLQFGFITTKVYIKEQDISSGVLIFDLSAGTIGEIRFANPSTWGTWKNAFPMLAGDILNIRDIEQGLEQMRRLSSQEVDISIKPSEQIGKSDLVIEVKRGKSWNLVTTFDDSGSKNTGKNQGSMSLQIENLLSINDIFYVSFNQDMASKGEEKGTRANSFYYSFPMGKQTFSISKSINKYHQTAYTAVTPIEYSGKSENFSFIMSHLLYRDQIKKTHMEVALLTKKRRAHIDDTEITVQRQDTTALRLGVTHRQYTGSCVIDAALRFQKGVGWLGAQDGPTDHLPGEATTRYNMWFLDFNFNAPIRIQNIKGRYNLNIRTQKTNNPLYGSDFFSIGGRYTVRGFDGEQTLSAENGYTIRNEFSLDYIKNHQIYLNIDYGKLYGSSTQYLLGTELFGMTLGVRGNLGRGMIQYDAFVGWPLKKPEGFKTPVQTYGFMLTMQL